MENMEKYFTIRNGRVSGLQEKMGVTLSQSAYDALSDEKKNDGTIYFIPDGDGEIEIVDNEISETKLWSSQKIVTELKTSSNTEPITIAFPNIVKQTSYGNASQYQIRNGICYVTMDIMSNEDSENTVVCELPMSTMMTNISVVPFALEQYNQNGMLILSTNGVVKAYGLEKNIRYAVSFSYPIA